MPADVSPRLVLGPRVLVAFHLYLLPRKFKLAPRGLLQAASVLVPWPPLRDSIWARPGGRHAPVVLRPWWWWW